MNIITSILVTLLLFGSSAFAENSDVGHRQELCDQIQKFSRNVAVGNVRSVRLGLIPQLGLQSKKTCLADPMDGQGKAMCQYLSEHTSNERIAGNISQVLACIEGSSVPTTKNIWTKKMVGDITVSEPYVDIKNVDLELIYSFTGSGKEEDYFQLIVRGSDNSE